MTEQSHTVARTAIAAALTVALVPVAAVQAAPVAADAPPVRFVEPSGDGAGTTRWGVAGCFTDAEGDTVEGPDRVPADAAQADITAFCVDHTDAGLSVEMTVREPTDPLSDTTWEAVGAAVAFGFETVGGERRVINLTRPGTDPAFEFFVLEPEGTAGVICSGAATFADGTYQASIPAACLAAPDTVEVGAQMFYDVADGQDTGFFDAAPGDGGFVAVPRTTPQGADRVSRLAGASRVETAIVTAQASYPDGTAGAVVLARAGDFPDALVAAPLAVARQAPVLLTSRDALHDQVADEIDRLLGGDGEVILLGGTAALSATVADQVVAAGHTATRIAGDNRFATAVAAARAAHEEPQAIVVAGGGDFPDALLAGAVAPGIDGVAVLVDTAGVPATVQGYLGEHPDAVVMAVGTVARAAVEDPDAYAEGLNPSRTSVALLELYSATTEVVLASVEDFPDGLAGGAYAAARGIPLLLTPTDALESEVRRALADRGPFERITLMGGTAALSDTVAGQAAEHLAPATSP